MALALIPGGFLAAAALLLASLLLTPTALAWPRYNDVGEGGGCSDCHGSFTGATSPKGTLFPSDDKHFMHRDSSTMNTDCNLCHSAGDQRNPYTGFSNGTAANAGVGCSGCHEPTGLRAHHLAKGVVSCTGCHTDGNPPSETVKPPYYGTVDTRAKNPCNDVKAANTNENWSLGDFLGLDNDGNTLYDVADFACNPYQVLGINVVSNSARITWLTAGGRKDALQVANSPAGPYTNLGAPLVIPGVGIVTTNFLDVGAASNSMRFYRVRFTP